MCRRLPGLRGRVPENGARIIQLVSGPKRVLARRHTPPIDHPRRYRVISCPLAAAGFGARSEAARGSETGAPGAGDCEDYALAKRRELINQGWAASTLLIAVVRQQSGAGHAVLMARTDRGDLVLDNQDGDIHLWNETPYIYLKRQSRANAGSWVEIVDQRPVLVAAVH